MRPATRGGEHRGASASRWRWWTAVGLVAVVMSTACGEDPELGAPTVDDAMPDDPEPEPDSNVDPEPTADAEPAVAAACSDLEDRAYVPPAEEQPPPDPALTTAEPLPDVAPFDDGGEDRDEPLQSLLDQVRDWALREAPEHFGGMWIDPDHDGATVVAFTDDVDTYAADVRSRFGDGWWVVESDHTEQHLDDVLDELVQRDMGDGGWTSEGDPIEGSVAGGGIRVSINRVTVTIVDPDDARLAELSERYGADTICFEFAHTPTSDDAQVAWWAPVDDADLSPQSTSIDVLVNERDCASGRAADGRITDPDITYGDGEVVVTISVVPQPGDHTCPDNPDTAYTVELSEPLGGRTLLDGGQNPPAPPTLGDH